MDEGHLERLRAAELQALRGLFPAGARVLEIGGGNGFQAGILADWGCRVTAVDIGGARWQRSYYPVREYDGRRLPFEAASFDVVFSSNVLEHVAEPLPLLVDARRVATAAGRAIHVLPSPVWRLWTLFGHYPYVLRELLPGRARSRAGRRLEPVDALIRRRGVLALARAALVPPPHGEAPSALAELRLFGRRRWTALFREAGWEVGEIQPNRLFYTGNVLLPGLSLTARRRLAAVLGSACHAYVMRPAGAGAGSGPETAAGAPQPDRNSSR